MNFLRYSHWPTWRAIYTLHNMFFCRILISIQFFLKNIRIVNHSYIMVVSCVFLFRIDKLNYLYNQIYMIRRNWDFAHKNSFFFFLNDCNKKSWLDWEKARILNFKNSKHHNINLIPLENNGRFKKNVTQWNYYEWNRLGIELTIIFELNILIINFLLYTYIYIEYIYNIYAYLYIH